MSIIVTARGAGMGAWVDEDFAHCRQVVVVGDDGRFSAWENPFLMEENGAHLAMRMIEEVKEIEAIVTQTIDSQAKAHFAQHGVPVFLAEHGAVLELVEAARHNELMQTS